MHVRTASTNDAELLAGFLIAEAREAEGREIAVERAKATVRVALAEPSLARYWIAQDNGVTLGAIEVTREWSDWNGAHYWWIQFVYVVPERRGTGVVRGLIQHVRDELVRERGVELRLLVHPENTRAIRAYEKIGFQRLPYVAMVLRD
jgi:ribosomal protein S18 acetylase RimI-like enzyme